LRAGRKPAEGLAFAAKDSCVLIGTLRLWHIRAGGVPALLLGPLAVAGACRSQGIGRRLMEKALLKAADSGHMAIAIRAIMSRLAFPAATRLGSLCPDRSTSAVFLGSSSKKACSKRQAELSRLRVHVNV
jgi:GNAT superfamily N-acetyltransferase